MRGRIQNFGTGGGGMTRPASKTVHRPFLGWGSFGKQPSIRNRQATSIASGRKIHPITLPKLNLPPHIEDED